MKEVFPVQLPEKKQSILMGNFGNEEVVVSDLDTFGVTETEVNLEETENSDFFDLDSFFFDSDTTEENLDEIQPQQEINLLVTLQDEAQQSIDTIQTKVTADSFSAGLALTSGVFSALGSIAGSCGVFCAHSLTSLANVAKPGIGLQPATGLHIPGFGVDANGNFLLEGNIDSLAKATGISKSDLLSGKFSAEDILLTFFSSFGESLSMLFGFGLVSSLIDMFFPATESASLEAA